MLRIRSKMAFLLGAGVGYYLGTGAGPERRQQLDDLVERLTSTPAVERVRSTVRRSADEVASTASGIVADAVDAAGVRVADAVDEAGDRIQDHVGPQRSVG